MVVVHAPLTDFVSQARAADLTAQGLFGDSAPTLRSAWRNLGVLWDDAVARARRLPPDALDENVDGEWSFIQTIRHLIFVADIWYRETIAEEAEPHHRWGMPPHFVADAAPSLGLDLPARPSLDEALDVWQTRRQAVATFLESLADEELVRTCRPRDGAFQVAGALQAIVWETWAHLQYAERDLGSLEGRRGPC